MKQALFISFLLGLLLCSCKPAVEPQNLIGTWEVMRFSADLPEISPEVIALAEQEALSYKYSFNEQRQFSLLHHKGEWQLDESGSELRMIYAEESELPPDHYHIDYLEGERMKWTQEMGEMGSLSLILHKKKI